MSKSYEWPSREQWAAHYQHPHWDEGDRCPYYDNYSHQLSDYATSDEVTMLTAALKNLYRELGRELRNINLHTWQPQRGEKNADWYRRFRQMSAEDQETFQAAQHLRWERSAINDVIKRIRSNEIPNEARKSNFVPGKAGELVAPINARYWAAFEAARRILPRICSTASGRRCGLEKRIAASCCDRGAVRYMIIGTANKPNEAAA
jgi:hypothetical protein